MTTPEKRNELCALLADLSTSDEVHTFLSGILTEKELNEISTRIKILKMLQGGLPQREIAAELGVGIATVTRGARVLRHSDYDWTSLLND